MSVYGKRPALRLDPESYNQLRLQILRRDGWKCQLCGRLENLQIHHQHFRSRGGSDSDLNLITLCADCHRLEHT